MKKINMLEVVGTGLFIVMLAIAFIVMLATYLNEPSNIQFVLTIITGLIIIGMLVYVYWVVLRPVPSETLFPFYFIFIQKMVFLTGIVTLCAGVGLVLTLVAKSQDAYKPIFLAAWFVIGVFALTVMIGRIKMLKSTDVYKTIDNRIKSADLEIHLGGRPDSHAPAPIIKKMGLSNVFWFWGTAALFLVIGIALLVVVVLSLATAKWSAFLLVPLLFGIALTLFSLYAFSYLFEILLGKTILPGFLKKNAFVSIFTKPLISETKATGHLLIYAVVLIVVLTFSMAFLFNAIRDLSFDILSVLHFIGAIFCAFIGFSIVVTILSEHQKLKKRRKPVFDQRTILSLQKGLLVMGHLFGYGVILGGLVVILELGGGRLTLSLGKFETGIPWLPVLWVWLTVSDLSLFHQQSREFHPPRWSLPFPVNLTNLISKPFESIKVLNLMWLISKLLEKIILAVAGFLRLDVGLAKRRRYTLPEAQALAEPVAVQRDKDAFLFALRSGAEGISLDDQQADGWIFSYYLPSKKKSLEVVVSGGKTRTRRSKPFPGEPPARLSPSQIDPSQALQKTKEHLQQIYANPEEELLTMFLYLPASGYHDELVDLSQIPEQLSWLVRVFDQDMEHVKDIFVDAKDGV